MFNSILLAQIRSSCDADVDRRISGEKLKLKLKSDRLVDLVDCGSTNDERFPPKTQSRVKSQELLILSSNCRVSGRDEV